MSQVLPVIASEVVLVLWNSLCHAAVIVLHGPEADDRVDNGCRVH